MQRKLVPCLLMALLLAFGAAFPAPTLGQVSAVSPATTATYESHFDAPQPLPDGPLDHVLAVVNFEPGAATPAHYHPGPGFATLLQGQVVHRRVILDRDTRYGVGETWIEIPGDVHYARDLTLMPATILATYILPQGAPLSHLTHDQPHSGGIEQTVPALARQPITSVAGGYAVTQFMRTYIPGASEASTLDSASQAIVIVVEGELTLGTRTVQAGDSWVEGGGSTVTAANATSSIATAVVSIVTPQP